MKKLLDLSFLIQSRDGESAVLTNGSSVTVVLKVTRLNTKSAISNTAHRLMSS